MLMMEHIERLAMAAWGAVKGDIGGDPNGHPAYDAVKAEGAKINTEINAEMGGYVHQEYPKMVDGKIVQSAEADPSVASPMPAEAMPEAAPVEIPGDIGDAHHATRIALANKILPGDETISSAADADKVIAEEQARRQEGGESA